MAGKGHQGGHNPFRDANGEFADPSAAGKPGRSRAGGPMSWEALPKSSGATAMNNALRAAAGRPTTGTPSAEAGEAARPTIGVGTHIYQYPKSKYSPEAKAKGDALNARELEQARAMMAPGARNVKVVAGSDTGTMAMVVAQRRQRGGGDPWLEFKVLDPATRGTNQEKWLEIPRGERRDDSGRAVDVVSAATRAREFVAAVNGGADFRETLKAYNGGQSPIDSTNYGPPMSRESVDTYED